MGLDLVAGEVLLAVVRVVAQEGVVALEPQLLGGGVQPEADDKGRLRELLRVQHFEVPLGDLLVVHHPVEDHVRHEVRDHP